LVEVGTDLGGDGTAAGGASATLTIEPGVVVTAGPDDTLIINRGLKINAVGTSTQPIIFTSSENILKTVDVFVKQYWGAIYIADRAPINSCDTASVSGGDLDLTATNR
jgi:hypothetical protein